MTDRGDVAGRSWCRRGMSVLLLAAIALAGIAGCGASGSSATADRQAEVEARGATVMPFDQELTTHVFRATPTGGLQRVVANHADDARQIHLIRAHLRREARRFSSGNFADPMAIHGMKMPGVAALRRGFERIDVRYSTIRSGARITYGTTDPALVTALHAWFDAQLVDHGADAHG